MKTGWLDIRMYEGATFVLQLTWYSDDTQTTPVDLTGYSAFMYVKENTSDETALLELTTANSRIILGGALGTIDLLVAADDVTGLVNGVYDLKLIAGDGTVTRLVEGSVFYNPQVTDNE